MNVLSFGSCLSGNIANLMKKTYGSSVLSSVSGVRSDILYHYHIAKDKDIIPRSYIDGKLIQTTSNLNDPNYVSPDKLLEYQYPEKSKFSTSANFIEDIKTKKIDLMILDNHIDLSAKLSYPTQYKDFSNSPIFLRKQDYINFDDFFTLGEQLTCSESIYYINKLIDFVKSYHPDLNIYFINYPYNTYILNEKRQSKARLYEKIFFRDDITIVPSPTIQKNMQKENDPSHFQSEIYTSLAGFVFFDFEQKNKKYKFYDFMKKGHLIENADDTITFSELSFDENSSWSVALTVFEYPTEKQFNFLVGKKGVLDGSILRRKNILELRTSTGNYIGGVEFKLGTINNIAIVYNKGNLIFYCNENFYEINNCYTSFACNNLGNSYNSKYDSVCIVNNFSIWRNAISIKNLKSYLSNDDNFFTDEPEFEFLLKDTKGDICFH